MRAFKRHVLLIGVLLTVLLTNMIAFATFHNATGLGLRVFQDYISENKGVDAMKEVMLQIREVNLRHVVASSSEAMELAERERNRYVERFERERDIFRRDVRGEEQRRVFSDFERAVDKFIAVTDQTLELSREGRKQEAREWIERHGSPSYVEAVALMGKLNSVVEREFTGGRLEVSKRIRGAELILLAVALMSLGAVAILINRELRRLISVGMQRQQKEKEQVAEQVAAGIGDSIVKPLWRAKSRIKYLQDAVLGGHVITPVRVAEATSKALAQMERVEEIINDLLLLSGTIPVVKSRLNCKTLIEDVVESLEVEAWKHGVTIDLQVEGNFAPIRGDQHLLKKAVANILLHAIDTNPQGAIVIVEARYASDSRIALRITDQRKGMSQADVDAAFTPFQNAGGLALAVSKWILKRHDAEISVSNMGGEGTEIRFLIPIDLSKDVGEETQTRTQSV